jgi:hypothetical protein
METELIAARSRRDKAVACAVLSLAIAGALALSNLGRDRMTEDAVAAVRVHREILAQNQALLHANDAELAHDLATLEAMKGPPTR